MDTRTKVRCGKCSWRGARKRDPLHKPCPRCGQSVVEFTTVGAYLLCLRNPDGTKAFFGHAGHYIGWSGDMTGRIRHHANGTGSNLMRHVVNAGIGFVLARTWPGADRNFERSLHNRGGASRICPLCKLDKTDLGVLVLHGQSREEGDHVGTLA